MYLDQIIRVKVAGHDVVLRNAITTAQWWAWIQGVVIPLEVYGVTEDVATRAISWLERVSLSPMKFWVELLETSSMDFVEIGNRLISVSSVPDKLNLATLWAKQFGADEYDPKHVSPDAPCQCEGCRGLGERKEGECKFYGFSDVQVLVANTDYQDLAEFWDKPLYLYQLHTTKKTQQSLGVSAARQKQEQQEALQQTRDAIWNATGLPPSPNDRR